MSTQNHEKIDITPPGPNPINLDYESLAFPWDVLWKG